MSEFTLRLDCSIYRGDLAYIRKSLAFDRRGRDIAVSLVCAPPHSDNDAELEAVLHRDSLYVAGFKNTHCGFYFNGESQPMGAGWNRKLAFSGNYVDLGAWDDDLSFKGVWHFHGVLSALAALRVGSTIGRKEKQHMVLLIFMLAEALRFWPIDLAVEKALCATEALRIKGFKEKVNNWSKYSKGNQSGALDGVVLPAV